MAIERAVQQGRIAICSVVAAEVRAGARDRAERQQYDRFFALCRGRGVTVTPDEAAWHKCGRMLSRYRERYGSLDIRDHQNDVLILLSAGQLAMEEETALLTQNFTQFRTWLHLSGHRPGLSIEAATP
jgi:predicted nucleic acid-binding protein